MEVKTREFKEYIRTTRIYINLTIKEAEALRAMLPVSSELFSKLTNELTICSSKITWKAALDDDF